MFYFLLLSLELFCSSLSSSFKCRVRLPILFFLFFFFFFKKCIAINVPLKTAFAAIHRLCIIVFSLSFISKEFLITLLISSEPVWYLVMYSLVFICLCFSHFFSCMISIFIGLWSESRFGAILTFLNLLVCSPSCFTLKIVPLYLRRKYQFSSVQFSCSVMSDSLQPMNCSTPGLPVHHQLPKFIQTPIHQVSDAIQASHPLSSPSPPAPKPSQHQSLFQ